MEGQRSRKSIGDLAVESAMIVLSVLLALAASRWVDSRKQQQLATQALASFDHEIRANQQRVLAVYPYHQALAAAARRLDSLGTIRSYADWKRQFPGWSGFRPPDVTTTAWQTALTTGALANLPYRQVGALSDAYTLQTMPATVRRMNAYMQTVISFETALLREYADGLRTLPAEAGTRAAVGAPTR
jgi:type II secretory pathway pseudopilin PulG